MTAHSEIIHMPGKHPIPERSVMVVLIVLQGAATGRKDIPKKEEKRSCDVRL
jgi:hypothetical protein